MTTPEQRKANRRLAFILLTVAAAFGVGFVVKMTMLGH